ncbi:MAG TPA: glycosyltransferase family 39 protein [Candidatus Dormibacteraeota bacterium]
MSWLQAQRSWNTLLVVAVFLVAGVIRFWNFTSLGYEHWDEVYFLTSADAVSKVWPHGLGSISWAITPLIPYTDGTLFHFFGHNNWMPLGVSGVYGTLSALLLYFLGSRLFGRAVGLIAAAVLATAIFSITFSRMALADATFDFWMIAAALFVWLAFTRRRIGYWVLAGVCTGLLLNTKYTGVFPLLLAGSWVVVELVVDLVARRRQPVSKTVSEYLPQVMGVAAMAIVALLMFAPWFLKLHHDPGFGVFIAHQQRFATQKTPADFIVWYYWIWTSPPTVLLAALGVVVGLFRFTRADRFLLIYTAGWFVALMLFDAYPREALSLLPAVAIWAARAVVEVWKVLLGWRPKRRAIATAAAVVCAAAILLGQALALPGVLSIRTDGYANAGALATRYQAAGSDVLISAQHQVFLYVSNGILLRPSRQVVQLLKERPSTLVFMTDLTLVETPRVNAFFELNRDRLQVIARVPNGLYPEVYLQPATTAKLSRLNNQPAAFQYITFWRVTGPLLYPPDWPK